MIVCQIVKLDKMLVTAAVARVTACNLAKVPLSKASLDVAIFCLALMGTDWTKFVAEVRCNCDI